MSAVLGALEDCPHAHLSSAARGVFSFSHILTASKDERAPPPAIIELEHPSRGRRARLSPC